MGNKKVLIIKLSSLGDVIFNIPLANVLKDSEYEVHWLTSEKGYPVLHNNTCVDKLILAPVEKWKKEKNYFKNIKEICSIIWDLRREKYDIAIDSQMRLKSLLFMKFCGAKRRIISKDAKELSILGANEVIDSLKNGFKVHVVRGYLKFADYLGLDTKEIKITLPDFSSEAKSVMEQIECSIDKNKKTIVIAAATTWKGKHWDKENWKRLLKMFGDKYNIIYTGTKNDVDLFNYIRSDRGIDLVGKTNLKELVEVLKLSDLVISLDSGTTHLAWGTQKPKIISIYCCTPKSLYSPIGDDTKYIGLQSDICAPCHHKKCYKKVDKYSCTKSPNVELVYKKVCELLD